MPPMERDRENNCWTKVCTACDKVYTVSGKDWDSASIRMRAYFYLNGNQWTGTQDGLQTGCKFCYKRKRLEGHYYLSYKINKLELLKSQDNKCAICEIDLIPDPNAPRWKGNLDHNHETGKVRGILCTGCNNKMAGVDDKEWLAKALTYKAKYEDN